MNHFESSSWVSTHLKGRTTTTRMYKAVFRAWNGGILRSHRGQAVKARILTLQHFSFFTPVSPLWPIFTLEGVQGSGSCWPTAKFHTYSETAWKIKKIHALTSYNLSLWKSAGTKNAKKPFFGHANTTRQSNLLICRIFLAFYGISRKI